MDGIPLGDIDLEMDMVLSEAEFTELKTKTFQVPKRLSAGVDVALFSKISVSIMGGKHHNHPVVSCVSRWLFIATAIYIFHTKFSPVAPPIGQAKCLPRATKKRYSLIGEKRDATFHLRVFHFVSDHAVFSVAVNK